MIIPNIWENKKCSKPPTRFVLCHTSTHIFIAIWSVAVFVTSFKGWFPNPNHHLHWSRSLWRCTTIAKSRRHVERAGPGPGLSETERVAPNPVVRHHVQCSPTECLCKVYGLYEMLYSDRFKVSRIILSPKKDTECLWYGRWVGLNGGAKVASQNVRRNFGCQLMSPGMWSPVTSPFTMTSVSK